MVDHEGKSNPPAGLDVDTASCDWIDPETNVNCRLVMYTSVVRTLRSCGFFCLSRGITYWSWSTSWKFFKMQNSWNGGLIINPNSKVAILRVSKMYMQPKYQQIIAQNVQKEVKS